MIIKKSPREMEKMAAAGEIHREVIQHIGTLVRPGITTLEIDQVADRMIRERGAIPSFKGYHGFSGSICTSPNEMIVHGIPGPFRLDEGDIISIDVGVTLDGWVADAAVTFAVGTITPLAVKLLDSTRRSLMAAVDACQVGNHVRDISRAVQTTVEADGFGVVRQLVGHGVGRDMHEDPQVPNFVDGRRGPKLEAGMVIAVEPMVTVGSPDIVEGDDGWAIYTRDGSLAAHYEFTIGITDDGPRIMTPWHQGPNAL